MGSSSSAARPLRRINAPARPTATSSQVDGSGTIGAGRPPTTTTTRPPRASSDPPLVHDPSFCRRQRTESARCGQKSSARFKVKAVARGNCDPGDDNRRLLRFREASMKNAILQLVTCIVTSDSSLIRGVFIEPTSLLHIRE